MDEEIEPEPVLENIEEETPIEESPTEDETQIEESQDENDPIENEESPE